jgi:hypothetical protein
LARKLSTRSESSPHSFGHNAKTSRSAETHRFGHRAEVADGRDEIAPDELRLNAQDHAFMEQAAQREQRADDGPRRRML